MPWHGIHRMNGEHFSIIVKLYSCHLTYWYVICTYFIYGRNGILQIAETRQAVDGTVTRAKHTQPRMKQKGEKD